MFLYPMQVLSPATILAVDLAALTLLDLPCLVAVILGVLVDEFGWIAKSFPQAFGVSTFNRISCSWHAWLLSHRSVQYQSSARWCWHW
jgi:hypothetical protein